MENRTAYELWCPEGFVFPDDPSNPLNQWVTNSSCAAACISSKPVQIAQQKEITLLSWIGAISIGLLLLTHLKDGKSLSYLTVCTLYYTGVLSLMFIFAGSISVEKTYCHDNSITMSQDDGFTFCAFQACICCYTGIGVVMSWYVVCTCLIRFKMF